MSRILTIAKVNPTAQTVPINKGGTAATTLAQAVINLRLATAASLNQALGPIGLDAQGKIPTAKLQGLVVNNIVSLQSSLGVIIGQTSIIEITDYHVFQTYTITVSAGTVSRNGAFITFTAPTTVQTVSLTVNGRVTTINVTAAAPAQPTITSPVNGSTGISSEPILVSNAFTPIGDSSTHASSDWQIATDAAFVNLVNQATNDAVNKTSFPSLSLSSNTIYYARVRYKGSNGSYSAWSNTVNFSINYVGATAFSAVNRLGTGAASSIATVPFAPDVVIARGRAASKNTVVYDKLRGGGKLIYLNTTDAQIDNTATAKGVVSFNTFGVSFGSGSDSYINQLNADEMLYFFKQVTGIFALKRFTTSAVVHNLGVKPELIISKDLFNASTPWNVFCKPKASNNIINNGVTLTSISVINPGSAYTTPVPTVTISGGGGSGATATAVMVRGGDVQKITGEYYTILNQSYEYLAGWDYTSLPTVSSWSGANVTTNPTPTIKFLQLYDFSGQPEYSGFTGSGVPDGTYTVTGGAPFGGFLINPTSQVTVVNNVVTNWVQTNIGLAYANTTAYYYINHPTLPNSNINIRKDASNPSPRKGVTISAIGGSATTGASATLTYSGGGGNGSGTQSFSLSDRVYTYSFVPGYSVQSITLNNPGTGYTSVPSVTITGDGSGAAATVNTTPFSTSTPTTPQITKIVLNGNLPTTNNFFIDEPTDTGFNAAVGAVNGVAAIALTNSGSNYSSTPTVSLSGGGGSGAAAVANLNPRPLLSITRTAAGSNYTSVPTVSITGGGGTGATATAVMTGAGTTGENTWYLSTYGDAKFYLGLATNQLPPTITWGGPLLLQAPVAPYANTFTFLPTYKLIVANFTNFVSQTPQGTLPDGNYTGYPNGLNYDNQIGASAVATASVVNNVVTNVTITAAGLYDSRTFTESTWTNIDFLFGNGTGAYIVVKLSRSIVLTQDSQYQCFLGSEVGAPGSNFTDSRLGWMSGDTNPNIADTSVTLSWSGNGRTGSMSVRSTGYQRSVKQTIYTVGSITLTNAGTGYTSAPTVAITGGDGTGATATAALTTSAIASISVTNPGTGYTSAPTVAITAGGGTAGAASAFLGNGVNGDYISYALATYAGVSKVFSYRGNGTSLDIDCGFTSGAKFILILRTDAAGDRYIWDSTRGITSGNDPRLSINDFAAAEVTSDDSIAPLGIGFTAKQNSATNINVLNASYIGFAFS